MLLATLALLGSKALNPRDKWTESRDIWSGDTVIVTDLMRTPALVAAPESQPAPTKTGLGPPSESPSPVPPTLTAPRPAADRAATHSVSDHVASVDDPIDPDAPPPRKRPTKQEEPVEPPQDDLAARILAYHPPAPKTQPESESAGPVSSTMGAAGAAGRPREFARAFTRAIPAANTNDTIWDRLPLGDAGSIVLDITLDDTGTISNKSIHDKPQRPPPFLEHLVNRTLLALKGGQFVLTGASRGTQTIRVDVVLSERAVGNGPLELGFETPRPGHPGRGYFQLSSGRFVEARVTIEN